MQSNSKFALTLGLFFLFPMLLQSQTEINPDHDYTPNQLIEDIFIGGNCFELDAQSISYTGHPLASGYFSTGDSSINIEEGIILSTGDVNNCIGPNSFYNASTAFNQAGIDPDLSQLVNNEPLFDIVALEFDFTPTTNQISFEFVFASEEYCEYVFSPFNDAFGFFISGPGIDGPFSNNAENIALVPNTTDYMAINSVNHLSNSDYYIHNIPADQHSQIPEEVQCINYPSTTDGQAINDIEFDGFTTVMTASAEVQACETYHIRLVIADVGDAVFDSAVFLKANSFSAGESTTVTAEVPGNVSGDQIVYEDCLDGHFVFTRNDTDLSEPLVVHFDLSPSSTATSGVDFEALPDSIIIPAGASVYYLPVVSIADMENEGSESIILELESSCSCTAPIVQMDIQDVIPLSVNFNDIQTCESDSLTLVPHISGGSGNYSYLWNTGATTPSIDIFIEEETSYSVSVTDICGESVQGQLLITINDLSLEFATEEESCPGTDDGTISITPLGGTAPYTYDWSGGLVQSNYLENLSAGSYTLTLSDSEGCSIIEEIQVPSNTNIPEANAGPSFTLDCNITTATLNGSASIGTTYTYQWSTDDGNIVSGAQSLNPIVDQPGIYFLAVTDMNTACTVTDKTEVFINIIAPNAEANVLGPLILDCFNPTTTLDASSSQPFGQLEFVWSTVDGNIVSGDSSLNPLVDAGGIYSLTVTNLINGCTDTETITIGSHMLFPQVIIEPSENLNCQDSTIIIQAINSSNGDDFAITWTTADGHFLTGENSLMPSVDQPGTYILSILNEANNCVNSDSIVILEDINLPLAFAGDAMEINCQDSLLQLDGSNSSTGIHISYQWTSSDGNIQSGGTSLQPNINTPGTYLLQVTNEFNACVAYDSVEVSQPNGLVGADVELILPECYGDLGAVVISAVDGGTAPYLYSIDGGQVFNTENIFLNLPYGNTSLVIQDAEGCEYFDSVSIPEVPEIVLELAPMIEIDLGDSYQIEALVNLTENEIDSILWTPNESLSCSNCLNPIGNPLQTTIYQIQLWDENACPAEAEIMLRVNKDPQVFIPNVFSPNADGVNDNFFVFAKDGIILNIPRFQIFNRWGGEVFRIQNALPNDPAFGWDGTFKGKRVNPSVFVYLVEVELIGGEKIIFKGDVTVSD